MNRATHSIMLLALSTLLSQPHASLKCFRCFRRLPFCLFQQICRVTCSCRQRIVTSENSGGIETKVCSRAEQQRGQAKNRNTAACRDTEHSVGNKYAFKVSQRVEMGWLHFVTGTYPQISARGGGGTLYLSVEKSVTSAQVLQI